MPQNTSALVPGISSLHNSNMMGGKSEEQERVARSLVGWIRDGRGKSACFTTAEAVRKSGCTLYPAHKRYMASVMSQFPLSLHLEVGIRVQFIYILVMFAIAATMLLYVSWLSIGLQCFLRLGHPRCLVFCSFLQ